MPKQSPKETVTIQSGQKKVTVTSEQFSRAVKTAGCFDCRDVDVVATLMADIAEQLAENWPAIRKTGEQMFREADEDAVPVAKAGIAIEVDYSERSRPKIKVRLTWAERHRVEVEHQLDDPKQGRLPLREAAGASVSAAARPA